MGQSGLTSENDKDADNAKRYHFHSGLTSGDNKDADNAKRYHFHSGLTSGDNKDADNAKQYHFQSGLTSGNDTEQDDDADRYHFQYHFGRSNEWSEKLEKFDFNGKIEEAKKMVSTELVDGDDGMVPLTGEDVWEDWKSSMKRMNTHDEYELAMFLYCMLN